MNKPLMQSRFGNKYKTNYDLIFGKKKIAYPNDKTDKTKNDAAPEVVTDKVVDALPVTDNR